MFTSWDYIGQPEGRPPQVDDQWPANGYNSPTLTPELIASGSDPDGDPVGYDFTVYQADGTVIADSGWQAANDVVVPAGTLAFSEREITTSFSFVTLPTSSGLNFCPTLGWAGMITPSFFVSFP